VQSLQSLAVAKTSLPKRTHVNEGGFTEIFNVTVYVNTTVVEIPKLELDFRDDANYTLRIMHACLRLLGFE
jgi:hypothetical protein